MEDHESLLRALQIFVAWAVCCVAYLYLRVAKTLPSGPYLPYGVFVLLVEVLGASATGIYGVHIAC